MATDNQPYNIGATLSTEAPACIAGDSVCFDELS
jgi:hypothetical protein